MQVSAEVVIQRPVAEVFAYVADLQNAVEWAPGVLEAARTRGEPGERGTIYDMLVREGKRSVAYRMQVLEVEVDRRFRYRASNEQAGARGGDTIYDFAGAGRDTRVRRTTLWEAPPLVRAFAPLIEWRARRPVWRHLDELKRHLESGGGAGGGSGTSERQD